MVCGLVGLEFNSQVNTINVDLIELTGPTFPGQA